MEVILRNWFRRHAGGVGAVATVEAYREGRREQRRLDEAAPVAGAPVVAGAPMAGPVRQAELDAAYERGRLRSRRRRGGSPLLTLVVLLAVVLAGAFIYLAIQNGSFSSGGAVVDQKIDQVQQTVDAPIKNAAINTGSALQRAGQRLK
jgi:flagellin-like protein